MTQPQANARAAKVELSDGQTIELPNAPGWLKAIRIRKDFYEGDRPCFVVIDSPLDKWTLLATASALIEEAMALPEDTENPPEGAKP